MFVLTWTLENCEDVHVGLMRTVRMFVLTRTYENCEDVRVDKDLRRL